MIGPCVLDVGHGGRCRSVDGHTWDGNHPSCPGCIEATETSWRIRAELDATRRELSALRSAVAVLLDQAPAGVEQLRLAMTAEVATP